MTEIAVFGAGGRAGRAVTAEARRRGHRVTAVTRVPERHPDLAGDGVRLVGGDVTDAPAVAALLPGHAAVVNAVTPASSPEELGEVDPEFFARAADALVAGAAAGGVRRIVAVGLFATLLDAAGRPAFDDPALFPPELRPFARSHDAELERLRQAPPAVDWLVLAPPARLELDAPRSGRYVLGDGTLPDPATARLSYADLAVAIVDEIESPTRHRERVSVVAA